MFNFLFFIKRYYLFSLVNQQQFKQFFLFSSQAFKTLHSVSSFLKHLKSLLSRLDYCLWRSSLCKSLVESRKKIQQKRVFINEVEDPANDGPTGQATGEDQPTHGHQAKLRLDPVMQAEILNDGSTAAKIVRETALRLPTNLNLEAFDRDIAVLVVE